MDKKIIEVKMKELESILGYKFNDISWLEAAMCSKVVHIPGEGKNGSNHSNDGLATLGDAILKFVLTNNFFKKESTKREITEKRKDLENNKILYKVTMNEGIINYAYNDKHFYDEESIPKHEKVVDKKHDTYLEAIIGAIYKDSNTETVKEWIDRWLIPLLEKYKY